MITPEEFPYIKSLYVNDCYAYQDFPIELHDYKPFSHLILTGKNGSGKSTILKVLDNHLQLVRVGKDSRQEVDRLTQQYEASFQRNREIFNNLKSLNPIIPAFGKSINDSDWKEHCWETIYAFLRATRKSLSDDVSSVVKENELDIILDRDSQDVIKKFKQYLVNKKITQAFSQLNGDKKKIIETDQFFESLTDLLRKIFEDEYLNLEFYQENFEFIIVLCDARQLTFDVLPDGLSAFLGILLDLLIRTDLIRKQVKDYNYNPCGIVLIDEPEAHLHLQLQEQVLPLLTNLFPNIQFIAATHSPAVIASIKNATIFDLTTKESRGSEETVGRSYSDLMVSHFGLGNEYSATADDIINEVNKALATLGEKPAEMKDALQKIYDENSEYLSPTLKVELELLIAQQEAQQAAHQ